MARPELQLDLGRTLSICRARKRSSSRFVLVNPRRPSCVLHVRDGAMTKAPRTERAMAFSLLRKSDAFPVPRPQKGAGSAMPSSLRGLLRSWSSCPTLSYSWCEESTRALPSSRDHSTKSASSPGCSKQAPGLAPRPLWATQFYLQIATK
jgi:hypothetical protein